MLKIPLYLLIIFAVTLSLTIACQPQVTQLSPDCQIREHSIGETCIPKHWERLVTIDNPSLERVKNC